MYKKLHDIGNDSKIKENYVHQTLPNIKTIEDKRNFIKGNKVCVVYIYADFCHPCKIVAPLYEQLYSKYYSEGVCVLIKENAELNLSSNVTVVPTFQFFINGNYETTITGADIKSIEDKINELIAK